MTRFALFSATNLFLRATLSRFSFREGSFDLRRGTVSSNSRCAASSFMPVRMSSFCSGVWSALACADAKASLAAFWADVRAAIFVSTSFTSCASFVSFTGGGPAGLAGLATVGPLAAPLALGFAASLAFSATQRSEVGAWARRLFERSLYSSPSDDGRRARAAPAERKSCIPGSRMVAPRRRRVIFQLPFTPLLAKSHTPANATPGCNSTSPATNEAAAFRAAGKSGEAACRAAGTSGARAPRARVGARGVGASAAAHAQVAKKRSICARVFCWPIAVAKSIAACSPKGLTCNDAGNRSATSN